VRLVGLAAFAALALGATAAPGSRAVKVIVGVQAAFVLAPQ
jgi:hypothetical protein